MNIGEKLRVILAELRENKSLVNEINDSTDLINDVGLDSLQMINFLLKLEDEFDIEVDFDNLDFTQMRSFGKLVKFIEKQVGQRIEQRN
ncbi:MAG: acyl carrier protein [Bacteroidales bacterium]|nr:acyl carrier protein [Bacteroidales bacterium]